MKRLLIAVLLAALVSALPAQTIRVVLWFQAPPGLPEAAVMDLSEAIIQGALDKSFESGFIGTNDRPRAGSLEVFQNYLPGEDSLEGFVDYELLIFADFMRQETS